MSDRAKGWATGKPASFAPSVNARWVEPFNEILEERNKNGSKCSRNKLTEELLEDGLKYRKMHPSQKGHVMFPENQFIKEELDILKSEIGLDLVRRAIIRLLNDERVPDNSNENIVEKSDTNKETLAKVEPTMEKEIADKPKQNTNVVVDKKDVQPTKKTSDGIKKRKISLSDAENNIMMNGM